MAENYRNTLFGGQSLFTDTKSPASSSPQQTSAGGGSNSQQQSAGSNQPQYQTFQQLQQAGVARPAPQQVQLQQYQQYGGSNQASQLRTNLQQQFNTAAASPSRYDNASWRAIRGAQASDLQNEYQAQLAAMNTDMARRGLYDSTYAGQAWQSLTGAQARALANLDATLLKDSAETLSNDRLATQQMGLNLANLAGSQDLATFEANRVATAANNEAMLRQYELDSQNYNASQNRALEAAQSAGTLQNNENDLRLRELLGLGDLDIRQQGANLASSNADRQFGLDQRRLDQEQLQFESGQQFTGQQNELSRNLTREQSALDRGLTASQNELQRQLQMQLQQGDQQFSGQQNELQRALTERLAAQENQMSQQQLAENRRQFDVGTTQTEADRALRERLGMTELSGYLPGGGETVARTQATADSDLARQNMLISLLNMLGLNNLSDFAGGVSSGQTQTGTPTSPSGTIPNAPANRYARRPGESLMDYVNRLRLAMNGTAPSGAGTAAVGSGVEASAMPILMEALGYGG